MSAPSDWPLLKIVDEALQPTGRYAIKTLREYRTACRRFEKFRGFEQRACYVTPELLKEFLIWQKAQGYRDCDAGKMAQTVATVVRHADPSRLPRWQPRRRALDGKANESTAVANWPLVRVVDQIVGPTGTRAQRTIVKYRQACRRFCRFRGSPQRVCDVTPELVEQFAKWQVQQGYSEGTASDACDHLAAVVRCADKGRLPLKYRRPRFADARHRSFEDKGVDGTLESVIVNQYFPMRSRINDPKTELQYAHAAGRLSGFLGRPATLGDLSDLTLGRWMRSMRNDGLEPRTINGYMNKLRAFWTWAAKRRLVQDFPTIENMPEPRRIPRCWTREELSQLMAGIGKLPGLFGEISAAAWWRAFYLTCWDTGERTGALLDLRWEFLNASTGELEAPAEIRKGRVKALVYRLKPPTLAALEAIRQPSRDLIFAMPCCRSSFYNHHRRLLKSVGLTYEKRRSGPQKMRRSFASFVEAAGGNATAALDHTARKVTTESYLDPRITQATPHNAVLFDLEGGAA